MKKIMKKPIKAPAPEVGKIEWKIQKDLKRVLLYGEPNYVLISVNALTKFKKEKADFKSLVFNGGKVTYTVDVSTNECERDDPMWKDHLEKRFYLELVVTNLVKGVQVVADPGNEFAKQGGKP